MGAGAQPEVFAAVTEVERHHRAWTHARAAGLTPEHSSGVLPRIQPEIQELERLICAAEKYEQIRQREV